MSTTQINQVLEQMKVLAAKAQNKPQAVPQTSGVDFGQHLKEAINTVNDTMSESGRVQKMFEQGESGVSLAEVMVASQKANISFQAMVQVRNKMVEAYKEIMNMPV